MIRHAKGAWLPALAVALVAACSTQGPSNQPGPVGSSAATVDPAGASLAPSLPAGLTIGPGELGALDLAAGLETLTSYRATLTVSFTGIVDGGAQAWSTTSTLLHDGDRKADQLTVETTGEGALAAPGQVTELDGVVFVSSDPADCSAGLLNNTGEIRARSEPASSLIGVVGAEAAGAEVVDGVDAERFTFDERALGQAGLTHSTGELWIATAGYLARYTLTSEGGGEYFGEGTEGTISWAYATTGANLPVSITIPSACPAGQVGAPTPAGATDIVDQPGLLRYKTSKSIDEVLAFHISTAGSLGWTSKGAALRTAEIAVLEYSVDGGSVTVIARVIGGSTSVSIVLERG